MKNKITPEKVEILKEKDVKISASAHKILSREAKNFKISRKKYLEDCIKFFASRGQNPESFGKNIENHLVSELKPIKRVLHVIVESQKALVNIQQEAIEETYQSVNTLVEEFINLQKQGTEQGLTLKKIEDYLTKNNNAK